MGKKNPPNFYAVAKGRRTGIFTSWSECEAQVKGCANDFKGFATREEAVDFLQIKGVALDDAAPPSQSQCNLPPVKRVEMLAGKDGGALRATSGKDGGAFAGHKRQRDEDEPNAVSVGLVSCDFSNTRVLPYGPGDAAATQAHLLWFDGGSRGNGTSHAIAGSGAVIYRGTSKVWEGGQYLGCTTNNVAEYTGLLHGLEVAKKLGVSHLEVRGDSKLVVCQVKGEWKCEKPHLKALCARAKELLRAFRAITLLHVLRDGNAEADALANRAMDSKANFEDFEGPGEGPKPGSGVGGKHTGSASQRVTSHTDFIDLTDDSDVAPSGSKRCKIKVEAEADSRAAAASGGCAGSAPAAAEAQQVPLWQTQRDTLDAAQRRAFDAALRGSNLFLTGAPRSGCLRVCVLQ
jgi:ribonuclease HI